MPANGQIQEKKRTRLQKVLDKGKELVDRGLQAREEYIDESNQRDVERLEGLLTEREAMKDQFKGSAADLGAGALFFAGDTGRELGILDADSDVDTYIDAKRRDLREYSDSIPEPSTPTQWVASQAPEAIMQMNIPGLIASGASTAGNVLEGRSGGDLDNIEASDRAQGYASGALNALSGVFQGKKLDDLAEARKIQHDMDLARTAGKRSWKEADASTRLRPEGTTLMPHPETGQLGYYNPLEFSKKANKKARKGKAAGVGNVGAFILAEELDDAQKEQFSNYVVRPEQR